MFEEEGIEESDTELYAEEFEDCVNRLTQRGRYRVIDYSEEKVSTRVHNREIWTLAIKHYYCY